MGASTTERGEGKRFVAPSTSLRQAFSLRRNLRSLLVPPDARLRPVDGFRALSILWVVLFHAGWYAGLALPLPRFVRLMEARWMLPIWRGDFGVDVFFVLSGFLIAGLLIDQRARGRIDLTLFYSRRALRLWPTLAVAAAAQLVFIGGNTQMIWTDLLYISNFVPVLQMGMGWTWSLAIEEQFYLVCPWLVSALARAGSRARFAWLSVVLVTLTGAGAYVVTSGGFSVADGEILINRDLLRWAHGFDQLYTKPWMRAGPLLAGVVVAYLFRSPKVMGALERGRTLPIAALCFASTLAVVATHWPLCEHGPRWLEVAYLVGFRTAFGFSVSYALLLSLSKNPVGLVLGRALSSRALYPIGQLAYAAYLLNPIVCTVLHKLLAARVSQNSLSPMATFVPVDLVGTFGAASLVYLFVERPLMELRPSRRVVAVPTEIPTAAGTGRLAGLVFGGAVVAMAILAWMNRFIQDDAFISFRYARHLATGHGLVWNIGEAPIQGFTNPLWTLLIALGMKCRLEPVVLSQCMGLICFIGTLLSSGALATRLAGSRWVGATVVVGLGLNASFNAYATGGLETQSQAMLIAVTAWAIHRGLEAESGRSRWFVMGSSTAALALWSRLDSVILFAPFLGVALLEAWSLRARKLAASLVAPIALGASALAAFGWLVFRALLPNTFYAKTSGVEQAVVGVGLGYVGAFLSSYQVLPLTGAGLYCAVTRRPVVPPIVKALCVAVATWVAYVVVVGGDFMEFRLFVPVLPLTGVLMAWSVSAVSVRFGWLVMSAGVAASGAFFWNTRSRAAINEPSFVETIHNLDAHISGPDQDWDGIGRGLGRAFKCDRNVTIATMAAGAIPYYSGLRTVDMLGLSDPWIARHGLDYGLRPGHRRGPTLAYLVSNRVNLVLNPFLWSDVEGDSLEYRRAMVMDRYVPFGRREELPADASIVEIPIRADRKLRVLYLVRDPGIDRCIAAGGWGQFAIRP